MMCRNDELSSALSWLFTTSFRTFYLICRKEPNPSQNLCYSHSLNFYVYVSGSPKSVSKQPTQLIVKLIIAAHRGQLGVPFTDGFQTDL